MITARSPYQIYKAENANGSVSDFNSLLIEDVLPYKIAAAEETLLASLAIVESDEVQKTKYAVSALHAASAYVSHLISYVPLSARSQTAKKIDIHYDAVVRTVMLFGSDPALFQSVKAMVLENSPANQVSLKVLSDLEGALTAMEKEHRQRAKDAGEKVDLLRKVAPEPVAVPSTPVRSQASASGPSSSGVPAEAEPQEASAGASTAGAGLGDSPSKRRPRTQPTGTTATPEVAGTSTNAPASSNDGTAVKVLKTEGRSTAADADAATGESAAEAPSANGATKSAVRPRKSKATASAGGASAATAAAAAGASPGTTTSAAHGLVWGRLRGLTNNEKKAVGVLQTVVQLLAHVYAAKFNDLVPIFDLLEEKVKTVQAIIDAERAQYAAREDKKPPEPFHEVDLADLQTALETSSHIFRTDEECRYELDEDLLHPIAHACLTVVNQIEGYATEPFKPPTPEELAKKQQLRDAARAKREEAKRKIAERAEAKAELERKREEEKQLMRRRLGDVGGDEEELQEDATLPNATTLGYVSYPATLPLGSPALYEKALYVWSMLVSVPRALNLSQMYFATFVKGLSCEDQDANGLMEEVTKCLLDVSMEAVRVSSPNTPRIATRGKNWFDALVEFVGVASGTKKKRQQQRRREPSTEEEEDEDQEEEEEDSDDESDDDEESDVFSSRSSSSNKSSKSSSDPTPSSEIDQDTKTKGKEDASAKLEEETAKTTTENPLGETTAAAEEEAETDPFTLELKATMNNITQLRSLATWGNIDMADRLNLLQFCLQEALSSEDLRNEADRLQKEREEEVANTEKKLKEIRDEAEKELKALLRTLPAVTAASAAKQARKGPASGQSKKAARGRKPGVKPEDGGELGVSAEEAGGADTTDHNDKDEEAPQAKDGEGDGEGVDKAEAAGEEEEEEEQDAAQTAARDYEAEREAILQTADHKRAEAYAHLYSRTDGLDDGAVVEPLGMDRYHRLYWRFPLERVVFVQSVPHVTAADFPVPPEPEELRRQRQATGRGMLLLDDEEVELPTRSRNRGTLKSAKAEEDEEGAAAATSTQRDWGIIPFEYLPSFVQTLDRRGKREAPLRRVLETLAPYLARLEEFKEGRVTRSRANMFGYLNRLKVDFSY